MKSQTLTKCFVLIAVLCCAATFAWSQATTYGQIRGQVTDPTGAVVAGASITLKNVNTGWIVRVLVPAAG
jgi:DNA-binding transcriptional regulator of glucitol operon